MRITMNRVLFIAVTLFFCFSARITTASKNLGGLRLNKPIECPDSVQFTWTGGSDDATYSIYRRVSGSVNWERIWMNLHGVSGTVFVPGFTLDHDYDYEIRAEQP